MKKVIEQLEIAHKANVNIAFWGVHGEGKSAVVKQYAKSINAHAEVLILSQRDPVTLGGYPTKVELESGKTIMLFSEPEYVRNLNAAAEEGKPTVLFLDEFNRAGRFEHNAAMTLVLDKEINGHKIPKDTLVVVAMNPPTEDDLGVNELTAPMIDRFAHVVFESNPKEWLDWADDNGVNEFVTGFIRKTKQKLSGFSFDFKETIGDKINATPRSWDAVGRVLNSITNEDKELNFDKFPTAISIISGLVGTDNALTFETHVKDNYQRLFTVDEIIKPTKKVLDRVKKLREDERTQVLLASLEVAHKEIPARYKGDAEKAIKDLKTGFFKFLDLVPVDKVASFLSIESDDMQFWSSVISSDETPKSLMEKFD